MEVTIDAKEPKEILAHPLVRALFAQISDGMLAIDARNRQILAMNDRARAMLGYQEEEVIGCQCKKMMNSPACSRACPLTALLEGKFKKASLELFYRGLNGQQFLHAQTRMLLVRGHNQQPLVGIELFQDLREVRALRQALHDRRSLEGMIGRSQVMQELYNRIEQIAPYDIPVLITGASGVGKERAADALQARSSRASEAWIKVNCAALSPALIESELFGHCRGAFTGATHERRGRFEEADGGTLLLDEIGDLALGAQAKLLRVLQDGECQRVGEDRTRKVDVRVFAATNRDLQQDIQAGRFRQDLYYRLLGAELHLVPLQERREDIALLAAHFLEQFQALEQEQGRPQKALTLTEASIAKLTTHHWPGNIRELEHVIRLAAIRTRPGTKVEAGSIEWVEPPNTPTAPQTRPNTLAEAEWQAIDHAMTKAEGNLTVAARILEIDRTTLWRKLKKRNAEAD